MRTHSDVGLLITSLLQYKTQLFQSLQFHHSNLFVFSCNYFLQFHSVPSFSLILLKYSMQSSTILSLHYIICLPLRIFLATNSFYALFTEFLSSIKEVKCSKQRLRDRHILLIHFLYWIQTTNSFLLLIFLIYSTQLFKISLC